MPKNQRLTGPQIRSLRSPRKVHGTLFSISISPLTGETPRFACVVSKKTAPKAVTRNLIKRRCREALRAYGALPVAAYVLTAKKAAVEATYAEIERDIAAALKPLGQTSR